ncbi:hypothetical protein ABIA35_007534 [Catenulispora sp. MAP12-49]|uniref:hypothetical protein n=1 Tax=Catenulispora sp. MAP12-49 TaxID=3156302 RepID=UPI003518D72C
MFRRTATGTTTAARTRRDLGVKFCDGYGVTTRTERSTRRLEAARVAAGTVIPRV